MHFPIYTKEGFPSDKQKQASRIIISSPLKTCNIAFFHPTLSEKIIPIDLSSVNFNYLCSPVLQRTQNKKLSE